MKPSLKTGGKMTLWPVEMELPFPLKIIILKQFSNVISDPYLFFALHRINDLGIEVIFGPIDGIIGSFSRLTHLR